jgi:hypothetical protein
LGRVPDGQSARAGIRERLGCAYMVKAGSQTLLARLPPASRPGAAEGDEATRSGGGLLDA